MSIHLLGHETLDACFCTVALSDRRALELKARKGVLSALFSLSLDIDFFKLVAELAKASAKFEVGLGHLILRRWISNDS